MNKVYYRINDYDDYLDFPHDVEISESLVEEVAISWYEEAGCDEDSRIIVSLSEHKDGPYTDFEVSIWHTVSFDARKL